MRHAHVTINYKGHRRQINIDVHHDNHIHLLDTRINKLIQMFSQIQTQYPFIEDSVLDNLIHDLVKRLDDMLFENGINSPLGFLDNIKSQVFDGPDDPKLNFEQFTVYNKIANYFIDASERALKRFGNDWEALSKICSGTNTQAQDRFQLISVKTMDGDLHQGGQTVLKLTMKDLSTKRNQELIYKPTDVLIDLLVVGDTRQLHTLGLTEQVCHQYSLTEGLPNSLLEFLEEEEISIGKYLVLPCRDTDDTDDTVAPNKRYGYCQFLPHQPQVSNDPNIHARYSYQAGIIAAVVTLLNMQDAHADNILISQLILYLIDLENALMPQAANPDLTLFLSGPDPVLYDTTPYRTSHNQLRDSQGQLIKVDPDQFTQGVQHVFDFFRNDKSLTWVNHPVLEQLILRVVPINTMDFSGIRRSIITNHYVCNATTETTNRELMEQLINIERDKRKLAQTGAFDDSKNKAIIGENISNRSNMIQAFLRGDIPDYHMQSNATYLLDPEHELIHDEYGAVVKYFKHAPVQSLRNRIGILQRSEIYGSFLTKWLQSLLFTILQKEFDLPAEGIVISVDLVNMLNHRNGICINFLKNIFQIGFVRKRQDLVLIWFFMALNLLMDILLEN